MKPDLLTVVTHRNWIAEEFEATNYIPVKHSLGFSAPIYPKDKTIAWWMPTETAARFLRAGVPLNLSTLDAEWLTRVSRGYTKREIRRPRSARGCGLSWRVIPSRLHAAMAQPSWQSPMRCTTPKQCICKVRVSRPNRCTAS